MTSATQLTATVPAGATTGHLQVTTGAGTATSSGTFTVNQVSSAPTITGFTPMQGAAGTVVTLTGTGFAQGASVTFNGTAAAAVSVTSATQLTATVPAGATSGPLHVTTSAGTATSAGTFTVPNGQPGLDLSIGGWYINQSVQTLGRTIPLVAGKDGFLRVFALANMANTAAPAVRVTVTGGTPSPWVQTITAPGAATPTAVAEDNLASSWNVAVPGAVLATGSTLKVELDPADAIPETDKTNNTLTAALDVRTLQTFHTTIIPITQQGLTGNVTGGGRTLANWVWMLKAMYPISAVDVVQGAPYTTQANLNAGADGWNTLLGDLNTKRVADGTGRYYFGAVAVNYGSGLAGLGYIGWPTAIGWDQSQFDRIFAHETGHNLNRWHAPCGVTGEPNWPADAAHAGAHIGVYGYDTTSGQSKGPSAFTDVMGYCTPAWVSDYTYSGILDFRAAGHLRAPGSDPQAEEAALPAKTECLLVSGQVRNGQLSLDPAYVVFTRPALPQPGEFTLALQDQHGATLLEVPFDAAQVGDSPTEGNRGFAFALPLTCAMQKAYRGLSVSTPTGVLVGRSAGSGDVFPTPTATALGRGIVRVEWDAKAFPTAMIRAVGTHEVLCFAKEGQVDLDTQAPNLEITLSDGVRSKRFVLTVPAE